MTGFLNFIGVLSYAGAVFSFALGYMASYELLGRGAHMAAGLVAALLVILWLSTVMFYLIGTGSATKDAARKGLVGAELYNRTANFKKRIFPPLMMVIVLFIVMPVLGAAHDAKKAPLWFHTVMAWVSVAAHPALYMLIRRVLRENGPIFAETVEAVNRAADRGAPSE